VLNDHERHTAVRRQVLEKGLESAEASGRCADADDQGCLAGRAGTRAPDSGDPDIVAAELVQQR
jgi:hypothetical protein